jgi:hypothetical protein
MSTVATRQKATTMNARERAQDWLNPVNLHWAGVALLGLVCVYLLVQMGFAWRLTQSQDAAALANQQQQLTLAKVQAKPLQGLDGKLQAANLSADKFYHERLPVSYSEVAAELGVLKTRSGVRLTRVQYAQKPVAGDSAGQLTEVDMDASLSGDYRPLMQFINGLERDKVFFLIEAVTLTGQQTGQVNLRVHVTTFLRGTPSDEERQAAEVGTVDDPAASDPASEVDKSIQAAQHRPGGSR